MGGKQETLIDCFSLDTLQLVLDTLQLVLVLDTVQLALALLLVLQLLLDTVQLVLVLDTVQLVYLYLYLYCSFSLGTLHLVHQMNFSALPRG